MQESILVRKEGCLCLNCIHSSSCVDFSTNQKLAAEGLKIDIVECENYRESE